MTDENMISGWAERNVWGSDRYVYNVSRLMVACFNASSEEDRIYYRANLDSLHDDATREAEVPGNTAWIGTVEVPVRRDAED